MSLENELTRAGVRPRVRLEAEELSGVLYAAVNTLNGKCYVGVTIGTFAARKGAHLSSISRGLGGCPKFYRAARKHGVANFDWYVLAQAATREELIALEIATIAKVRPSYNLTQGGDGVIGAVRTKEWRQNQSRALKGKVGTRYWLGKRHSPETCAKISAAKRGQTPAGAVEQLHKHRHRALAVIAQKYGYPVLCVEDGRHFSCIGEASAYYGLGLTSSQRSNAHDTLRRRRPIRGRLFVYASEVTR